MDPSLQRPESERAHVSTGHRDDVDPGPAAAVPSPSPVARGSSSPPEDP
jgi:hypothetical protein